MSNLSELLAPSGAIAKLSGALPRVLRLIELYGEADKILGELRDILSGKAPAKQAEVPEDHGNWDSEPPLESMG